MKGAVEKMNNRLQIMKCNERCRKVSNQRFDQDSSIALDTSKIQRLFSQIDKQNIRISIFTSKGTDHDVI